MKLGGFFRIVRLTNLFHEICSLLIVVVTFARHFFTTFGNETCQGKCDLVGLSSNLMAFLNSRSPMQVHESINACPRSTPTLVGSMTLDIVVPMM